MKKVLLIAIAFVISFIPDVFAEESPCPDLSGNPCTEYTDVPIWIFDYCPNQTELCIITVTYCLRVVRDANDQIISREIIIGEFSYNNTLCSCFVADLKSYILDYILTWHTEDFEITSAGTYNDFDLYSSPCYEHTGPEYYPRIVPCPTGQEVCCRTRYTVTYSGGSSGSTPDLEGIDIRVPDSRALTQCDPPCFSAAMNGMMLM